MRRRAIFAPSSLRKAGDTIAFVPQGSLTYADLATFPDDGMRRELLDGELLVSAAPYLRNQEVLGRLHIAFGMHVGAHGGGKVYMAPADVVLSDINVLEPDLLFVADAQRDILTPKNVQGAPALVVEVVSESRVDRVRKRDIYARFGVPEYWVVDPDADRVEIYRLIGDRYARPEILDESDVLTFAGLPGLEIRLRALFARD